jgi:hypothetical protein
LLDRGLSHASISLICVSINIGFILLAWFGRSLGPNYLMLVMLVLSFTGLGLLYYYRRTRRTMVVASTNGTTELKTASKVVTLTKETQIADQN